MWKQAGQHEERELAVQISVEDGGEGERQADDKEALPSRALRRDPPQQPRDVSRQRELQQEPDDERLRARGEPREGGEGEHRVGRVDEGEELRPLRVAVTREHFTLNALLSLQVVKGAGLPASAPPV